MNEQEQKQIFDGWLHEYKGILFKIVRAYAFNPHDQDDLFQEMSLQLWKSIPDFRGAAKASTWIYRVALYAAIAWVRKEKKQPETQSMVGIEERSVAQTESAHTLTMNTQPSDPQLDWLYEQIAQLDPIDRSVCLLMLEGFSYKEMAGLIGISESNVGVKIHRIKQHLVRQSEELEAVGIR